MSRKSAHPVGDLKKVPVTLRRRDRYEDTEMECRENKHPAAEISEHAYRRGFQHGLVAAEVLAKWGVTQADLHKATHDLACKLRYGKKKVPSYVEAFLALCQRNLSSVKPQDGVLRYE